MKNLRTKLNLTAIAGLLAATAWSTSVSAKPVSYDVDISAYVPIECEANFTPNLHEIGSGIYSLGTIRQFCNSRYNMNFSHTQISQAAQFQVRDTIVPAGTNSTSVLSQARAIDGTSEVILRGVNSNTAQTVSQSLSISVSASGL